MDERPSSSSSSSSPPSSSTPPDNGNNPNGTNICSEEIAPAILSTSGTWLRLSMPYFPKKSVVWRYFDLYESDGYSRADTERVVKCRLMSCMRKELRLDAQSSTKGMWEHLRNKHPDEALKCENGTLTQQQQEELNNIATSESTTTGNQSTISTTSSNCLIPDVYAPYSTMADEKKYETIHRLIGKLLESMQECQNRVHISGQQSLLSFADYARLLTKAKTTTQFVCREAPLILPEPGTIVIYDTKDNSGVLDMDMLQMRERLRQDGYSFDNNDSGLLPDNLYITRYFSGNGDDFEDGRIMRYEVTTTYEDAGYVLFHYVKGTKYEVEPKGNTGDIPVHCYKSKTSRLKRVDDIKRKADGLSKHGSSSHPSFKIKRNELDGLQAIAGCLPPSFHSFLENMKMEADKDENMNSMDLSYEENVEGAGSGVDDSQIEDGGGITTNIPAMLMGTIPNRDVKQILSAKDVKSETKVEKRVMNILKKAVRDQRRSKVHYLARRTKNVNWVKVADELQKKGVRIPAESNNAEAMPTEDITQEFEEELEEGNDDNNDEDGDDDNEGAGNNTADCGNSSNYDIQLSNT